MESHPEFEQVAEELGEKVVDGFAEAVRQTRADLADYRLEHPRWVADHGERGLANWLHDRLWAHTREIFDAIPGTVLHEVGPTREVLVKSRYRVRIKRHHMDGAVSNYLTASALAFFEEPVVQFTLDGLGEVRLIAGYEWDREVRKMGRAVLSLRDGQHNVIWLEELPEPEDGSVMPITAPSSSAGPTKPTVIVEDEDGTVEERGQG